MATNVKMAIFFIVESSDALVRNGTRSSLPGRNVTKVFLVFRRCLKVTQPVEKPVQPPKTTKVIISDQPINQSILELQIKTFIFKMHNQLITTNLPFNKLTGPTV